MIEAISGLSVLTAGLVAPATLRSAARLGQVNSADGGTERVEDSFEAGLRRSHGPDDTYAPGRQGKNMGTAGADPSGKNAQPGRPRFDASQQLPPEQQAQIAKLQSRDQEVHAHEQAHKAASGSSAGAVSYTYQTGPDGKRYAIGGETQIDLSPVEGDPRATILKMEEVRQAALAPTQPSAQDLRVAAEASQIETRAQAQANSASGSTDSAQPATESGESNSSARPASLLDVLGSLLDVTA